jgi:hypothetical protein
MTSAMRAALALLVLAATACGPRSSASDGSRSPGQHDRPGDAEPVREPLSEEAALRALYPRMDQSSRVAEPGQPDHAIASVTIRDLGDADHACLVTMPRSKAIHEDMNPDEVRDIEGSSEIIYDLAVLRVRDGQVSVLARARKTFAIRELGSGYDPGSTAVVELSAVWAISEQEDAILVHAEGSAESRNIGGSEHSGEYDYTESHGREEFSLYRVAGGELVEILAVHVESETSVDDGAPSADEGRTEVVGAVHVDVLDSETKGYLDIEVRTVVTRTQGMDDPEVTETTERHTWDGARYRRATP